ncbi:MAG: DoxX family protein [Acidobacteriota bacterium]|nr:DoxX family protein [Acidobacteriota bacterium]
MKFLARFEPQLRSLARIVIGFTFSLHGWQKIFGAFGGLRGHTPPIGSMIGVAGLLETIGGAFIILGLFTECTAFVLSGEMAVGYFLTHAPRGLWPIANGGELAVLYCFFFLWLSAAGAGPWSLDHLIRRSRRA